MWEVSFLLACHYLLLELNISNIIIVENVSLVENKLKSITMNKRHVLGMDNATFPTQVLDYDPMVIILPC